MQNRIVEIASDGVHLSLLRGFLKLSREGTELGRVALPDIGAVIVRGYGASLSINLAAHLAENGIPVVICGTDQLPTSVIWPLKGHHAQGRIMEGQSGLSRPSRKRLWQAIVQAKIRAQAEVLSLEGQICADLIRLSKQVRSGDPDNLEAQAARLYWPRMMGTVDAAFKRQSMEHGLNSWLNYGYAVLRAGAARSILSAGLHPSLSLHHESRGEALRLASDIMEPFRPYFDLTVRRLAQIEPMTVRTLEREHKAAIVKVLSIDLRTAYGTSPVQTCLDRLCKSLADICVNSSRGSLDLPSGLSLEETGDEE